MRYLTGLLTNRVLIATVMSWFFGQGSKMLIDLVQGRFSVSRLTGGGGMPSAHSATVTGLAVAAAMVYGTGSFEFVIALFFAIIVIYDAHGVRYETGRQSRALNRLREREEAAGEEPLSDRPFEEKLGHTVPEILAGILVGLVVSVVCCLLTKNLA